MRLVTAGESHGKCLLATLEGMTAGVLVDIRAVQRDLARRQMGHGRGGRMTIEKDTAEVLSGVADGRTTGAPITISILNKDFKIDTLPVVTRPRPGHADLAGTLKYGRRDVRDVLERASARETAARVAAGSICRQFLDRLGVGIVSHVVCIGGIRDPRPARRFDEIRRKADRSAVRCCDAAASRAMMTRIDLAKRERDTLGGIFEARVRGVPRSMASDKHLHARLAAALVSIQAVKGVEIDIRAGASGRSGPEIVLTGAMKPIATLMRPLRSVDINSKMPVSATVERSDVTAVPACAVIAEAMTAFEIADFFVSRFGNGDLAGVRRGLATARRATA